MCDLISAISVKSTHPIKSCLKTRKKENMKIKDIFTRLFWNEVHSFSWRADARASADIIYRIWCISL